MKMLARFLKNFSAASVLFLFAYAAQSAEPEIIKTGGANLEKARDAEQTGSQATTHAAKKKIAIAQFDVAYTQHVDDINNIYDGLPLVLVNRLEASGEFLPSYDGRSIPVEASTAQHDAIIQIARKTGAQFLLYGMVVNAGLSQEKGYLGTSIGGYKKRYIEIDLSIYDGHTGDRLMQRRFKEQAQGDVMVGNNKPFGSSIFFDTELGKALNRLLDVAVKDIRITLSRVPFSAHIIRVQEKKVFLDAGSDSLLKPGDKLVAYVRQTDTPVLGLNGTLLGIADRPADTITLIHVQPQFSIGELSEIAVKHGVKAGNLARINLSEQRDLSEKQAAAQQMAKAQQEAAEQAERAKNIQAAQDEAARAKAERAETDRINEEKKILAQAAAEAKASKLKTRQEAKINIHNAAQVARAREQAVSESRAAARAREAKQKVKAEALQAKTEATPPKTDAAQHSQIAEPEKQAEVKTVSVEQFDQAVAEENTLKATEAKVARLNAKLKARAASLKPQKQRKTQSSIKAKSGIRSGGVVNGVALVESVEPTANTEPEVSPETEAARVKTNGY